MAQYCADVVVRTWLSDEPQSTYRSSGITFIFESDGTDEDITAILDDLIQEHADAIQAKYLSGGRAELATRTNVISPLVKGITEC